MFIYLWDNFNLQLRALEIQALDEKLVDSEKHTNCHVIRRIEVLDVL